MKHSLVWMMTALTLMASNALAYNNPHILDVDLDIEGVEDPDEVSPGGFVAKDGLKRIFLNYTGVNLPTKTRLNWDSEKIEVVGIRGPEIYWDPASTMPTQLWVRGVAASDTGPDGTNGGPEHLCLEAINNGTPYVAPLYDRITFTVLDLELTFSDTFGLDWTGTTYLPSNVVATAILRPDVPATYEWELITTPLDSEVATIDPPSTSNTAMIVLNGEASAEFDKDKVVVKSVPAPCWCTNKFTVVRVNLAIQDKGEVAEALGGGTVPANCNDDDDNDIMDLDQQPSPAETNLVMVTLSIAPTNLPPEQEVSLSGNLSCLFADDKKSNNAASSYLVSQLPTNLWIEGKDSGVLTLTANHESGAKDNIHPTVILADVDLQFFDNTNVVDEIAEYSPRCLGTYVVLNDDDDSPTEENLTWDWKDSVGTNGVKRKVDSRLVSLPVTASPGGGSNDVTLSWPTDRLAVYTNREDVLYSIFSGQSWHSSCLPSFYIEGKTTSTAMKDCEVSVKYSREDIVSEDKIKVTVVSVDVFGDSKGNAAIDNDNDEVEGSKYFPIHVPFNNNDSNRDEKPDNLNREVDGQDDWNEMAKIYIAKVKPDNIPSGEVFVVVSTNFVNLFYQNGTNWDLITPETNLWSLLPVVLRAEGLKPTPQDEELRVTYKYRRNGGSFTTFDDHVHVGVFKADLDVDSDNTADYAGGVAESPLEDAIEDGATNPVYQAGKYLVVDDFYEDSSNTVPGYADWELTPAWPVPVSTVFADVKLTVPSLFDATSQVTFTYDGSATVSAPGTVEGDEMVHYPPLPQHTLRLWRRAQSFSRNTNSVLNGGDYIPPNVAISNVLLNLPGSVPLYLEGVNPSAALGVSTLKVRVEGSGAVSNGAARDEDLIKCTVIKADVDVDTDNDDGYNRPKGNRVEDEFEDVNNTPKRPGKIMAVNDNDDDRDGIPDYADGYDLLGSAVTSDDSVAGEQFVPVVFNLPEPIDLSQARVRVKYAASDPADVTVSTNGQYTLGGVGNLRLWRKDGANGTRSTNSITLGGDFVLSGDECPASVFGFTNGVRTVTYYAEAVRPSERLADQRILFEVDPDGIVTNHPHPGFIAADAVRLTAVSVKIQGDINFDGLIDQNDESKKNLPNEPGLLVPVNNNTHTNAAGELEVDYADAEINGLDDMSKDLKVLRLTLVPPLQEGTVVLRCADNSDVRIFNNADIAVIGPTLPLECSIPAESVGAGLEYRIEGCSGGKEVPVQWSYRPENGPELGRDTIKVSTVGMDTPGGYYIASLHRSVAHNEVTPAGDKSDRYILGVSEIEDPHHPAYVVVNMKDLLTPPAFAQLKAGTYQLAKPGAFWPLGVPMETSIKTDPEFIWLLFRLNNFYFWNITADQLYDMLLPLLGINPAEAEYYWQLPKIYTTGEHKFVIRDAATTKRIQSITVTVLKVDINGAYNRDGNPADHTNEADAVTFAGPKGMVILANTDDDVADQTKQPDCTDSVINGADDLADIYTLKLKKLGLAAGEIPSGMTLELSVENPSGEPSGSPAAKERVRIFRAKTQNAQGVVGPDTLPDKVVFKKNPGSSDMDIDLLGGTGDLEMGIEGIEYGREVIVKLVLKLNGQEFDCDKVRLLVSPFLVLANTDKATKVYYGSSWSEFTDGLTQALNGVVPEEALGPAFVQDFAEIGATRSAPGQTQRKQCVIMGVNNTVSYYYDLVDDATGYFLKNEAQQPNPGGNIEAAPPFQSFPYGRLVVGNCLHDTFKKFLKTQKVQTDNGNLIELPVSWLKVGHVDEVMTIVPAGSGFKVLVADLQLAIDLLRNNPSEETSGDFDTRAQLLAAYDDTNNAAKITLITNNLASIRTALAQGLGINTADLIKVPVAFGMAQEGSIGTKLPNMVNMIVVKNANGTRKLVVPHFAFIPMGLDLNDKLVALGYVVGEADFVDTTGPHSVGGEAHCASNARRELP